MIDKQKLQIKIGKRIRELRKSKKISQQDLAAFCDMETSNLSRLESGRTNPSIYTLKKIASNIKVSLHQIVKDL